MELRSSRVLPTPVTGSGHSMDPPPCESLLDNTTALDEALQTNIRIRDSLVTGQAEAEQNMSSNSGSESRAPTLNQLRSTSSSQGRGLPSELASNLIPPILSPQPRPNVSPGLALCSNSFNPFVPVQSSQNPFVNRVTQVVPSLPTFDGSEDSVQAFFQALDRAAGFAHWGEQDKIFALTLKLQGEAAKYYQEVVAKRGLIKFDEIKHALTTRFERRELPARVLKTLSDSYQRPTESVREFASRIEALSFRAFSPEFLNSVGGDRAREELLWGTFVEGLKPSIRRAIHHLGPRTFEAAVKFAIEEEELFLDRDTSFRNCLPEAMAVNAVPQQEQSLWRAQQDAILKLTETVTQLSNKVNALSLGQANRNPRPRQDFQGRPNRRPITCYRCGVVGHVRRDCQSSEPQSHIQSANNSGVPNANPENFRGASQ